MLSVPALAQLALSLAGWGCCAWLAHDRDRERARGDEFERRLPKRKPVLTLVLPGLAPLANDPLPRFRLTQFDGKMRTGSLQIPPPLPFSDFESDARPSQDNGQPSEKLL